LHDLHEHPGSRSQRAGRPRGQRIRRHPLLKRSVSARPSRRSQLPQLERSFSRIRRSKQWASRLLLSKRPKKKIKIMTEKFEIKAEDRLIKVCMYCHPGRSILLAEPSLAGISYFDLSHGICPAHKQKMMEEIKQAGQQPAIK
jgi:hypothetical protein